jgi:deoxyribonuclease V
VLKKIVKKVCLSASPNNIRLPIVCYCVYNLSMEVARLHGWQVIPAQAMELQMKLASQVSRVSEVNSLRLIAGVDISVDREAGTGTGAVVVLKYPELELVEAKVVTDRIGFPYVPGLLSFREAPLTLAACESLTVTPDLIMVDGQGIAHPRRMGLASHLGLFLDTPTIGCAKSRLCGHHEVPGAEAGNYAELVDGGEVIGAVLRTKAAVNPVYVSIGHKVDLPTAIHWVLECCRGYRLPEPARLAHLAAGGNLRLEKRPAAPETGYQERLFT